MPEGARGIFSWRDPKAGAASIPSVFVLFAVSYPDSYTADAYTHKHEMQR